MKTTVRFITLFTLISICGSCATKKGLVDPGIVILPLGDTVRVKDGSLVYGLPLTVLNFEVSVERKIEKSGPYAKYAGDLLGLKDIINQDNETWSVAGIKLNTTEELDPSELYMIGTNTLFQSNVLALKREGLILDINPGIYNNNNEKTPASKPVNYRLGFFDMGSDEYFVNQSDTAFRLVNVDTAFIKIPYLVEKKKQLTIDQLAEKAAKSLLELRDGRHLILTGEANVFPQDKSAIDEMRRLENEYLALFSGKTWIETRTLNYSITPGKDMKGKKMILFRFSSRTGPSDANGKTGNPVDLQFITVDKTKDLTIITKQKTAGEPPISYDKLFYRMPEIVTINIKTGEESLFSFRKLIYQFGEIMQLPSNYIIGK